MQQINVLMLGGKRCGKTTVLASMYREIDKALAGTPLQLNVDDQTGQKLDEAIASIEKKMEDFKVPLTRVEVDDNPTSAMKTYSFQLTLDRSRIPFQIHDIPGEWLTDDHQENVRRLVADSQVILIAIDTPYLFSKMTDKGYGIYHEEYNKPLEIANFFKNSLSVDNVQNRMILFVPIKCERYYHLTYTPQLNISKRNYMQELVNAVSCGYRDLLMYLRSAAGLVNNCTLAITPILSAGGIDFVRFRTDEETGKVISLYQEPEFLRENGRQAGYQPQFCEQPMIYTLIYILLQTLQQSSGQSFRGANQDQLRTALNTLCKKIKRNTGNYADDGFFFIQNPKNI